MTGRTILLTIRQVAVNYNLPEAAVRRWTKTGVLPTLKSGSRAYIVPASVEQLLDRQTGLNGELHGRL